MAKAVTLCSEKGTRSVRVSYPQMNFLGIWHMPFTDAPYVCIEPWSALPSRKGRIEDLSEQPNLVHLPASGMKIPGVLRFSEFCRTVKRNVPWHILAPSAHPRGVFLIAWKRSFPYDKKESGVRQR